MTKKTFLLRISATAFLFCIALFSVCLASAQAQVPTDARNVSFRQNIFSEKHGKLFEARTWIKNGLLRMEYIAAGQPMVSIIKEQKVYSFEPVGKTGAIEDLDSKQLPYRFGPEIIQSQQEMSEFLNLMGARKMKQEDIMEHSCDVFEFQDELTNTRNEIWIWQETGLPLKSKVYMPQDTLTIMYQDMVVDLDLDRSMFLIPSDIQFLTKAHLITEK